MMFNSAAQFKEAVRKYSIANGKHLRFTKNDQVKVRVRCKEKCLFLIHASKNMQRIPFKSRLIRANISAIRPIS